ncbi:MAG: hypothetical protein DMG05_28895, partial [Acidobacteria bacterium]
IVIDPKSGHATHEINVQSQQAGIAVSPDGRRLYVLDGRDYDEGFLRVFDTASWQVIFEIPVPSRAVLLGGNPLSLSGDGRWLLVQRYSYDTEGAPTSIFDTTLLRFRSGLSLDSLLPNTLHFTRMAGRPGHTRIYADLEGALQSFSSTELAPLWTSSTPKTREPGLVISPDEKRLYGLYPDVINGCPGPEGRMPANRMKLLLTVWQTATGRVIRQTDLTQTISVPKATIGRGNRGYLAMSSDGETLYAGWENRLWALDSGTFNLKIELALPFAVDGMTSSVDGTELYLLPTTAATRHPTPGLWTVATESLQLIRHTEDWPRLRVPFMFSGPAPRALR